MTKPVRNSEFDPSGLEDLAWWIEQDRKKALKIVRLIRECQRTPFAGTGKPEPLKHHQAGLWSCRVDRENRLVYSFDEESLYLWRARYHYIGIPNSSTIEQAIELKDGSV